MVVPSTATMALGWLSVTRRMNLDMFSKRSDEMRKRSAASTARTEVPWRHTAITVTVTTTTAWPHSTSLPTPETTPN